MDSVFFIVSVIVWMPIYGKVSISSYNLVFLSYLPFLFSVYICFGNCITRFSVKTEIVELIENENRHESDYIIRLYMCGSLHGSLSAPNEWRSEL